MEEVLTKKNLVSQVSYSSASESDHHRELVKKVKVVLAPSAYVTQWDVMPSETLNKSYLVLDIENRTEYEMEITYDPAKSLSIEPGDACRIPLPVNCFEITGIHDGNQQNNKTAASFQKRNTYW